MTTGNYYIDKLMQMPEKFNNLFALKRYAEAKYVYDTALRVATFLELDRDTTRDLFGYGSKGEAEDEDSPDGLFRRKDVQRCYYECCVKRNMGQENEMYRAPGEPVRYYPDTPEEADDETG